MKCRKCGNEIDHLWNDMWELCDKCGYRYSVETQTSPDASPLTVDSETKEKLLPCPFCGGRATVELACTIWWVKCHNCGFDFNRGERIKENIISAWNTRAKSIPCVKTESTTRGACCCTCVKECRHQTRGFNDCSFYKPNNSAPLARRKTQSQLKRHDA